jgi:hypothetical protein
MLIRSRDCEFELLKSNQPGLFYHTYSCYLGFRGITVFSRWFWPHDYKKIYFDPTWWPPYETIVDVFDKHTHFHLWAIIGILVFIKDDGGGGEQQHIKQE